jgi:holo-[acyl-carrier protein] synthase
LSWQDIEIVREESGRPTVILHGSGRKLFEALGAKQLWISLSHTEHYATATAILEG